MTKIEFEKFLEEKARTRAETPPIDWESRKTYWLQRLAEFYTKAEDYLAEFLDSRKVRLEKSKVTLTEEHIGKYEADSMAIFVGCDKVDLLPIGTLIFGASGRVDMIGPAGTAKFILTGKSSNGTRISATIAGENQKASAPVPRPEEPEELVWKLATPPPRIRFIELQPETFFSALTEVVNG